MSGRVERDNNNSTSYPLSGVVHLAAATQALTLSLPYVGLETYIKTFWVLRTVRVAVAVAVAVIPIGPGQRGPRMQCRRRPRTNTSNRRFVDVNSTGSNPQAVLGSDWGTAGRHALQAIEQHARGQQG